MWVIVLGTAREMRFPVPLVGVAEQLFFKARLRMDGVVRMIVLL